MITLLIACPEAIGRNAQQLIRRLLSEHTGVGGWHQMFIGGNVQLPPFLWVASAKMAVPRLLL
ncbi:MAG: hypothetical protein ABGZ35_14205 [Planctomycetaceae bacterium]|jgi:hypothetical protein